MKLLELDIENIAAINGFKFQRISNAAGTEFFLYKHKRSLAYLGVYLWKEKGIYHLRSGKFNAKYNASEMDCLLAFKNCEVLEIERYVTAEGPKEFLTRLIEELRNK